MNVAPALQFILEDVSRRFGAQVDRADAPQANEVYLRTNMESVAGLCARFYRKWNGRLVSLFAEDARPDEGCYLIYYVFAFDAAHGRPLRGALPVRAPARELVRRSDGPRRGSRP